MYAACGPPKPTGTPKRCVEPIAISAFIAPGSFNIVSARISAEMMAIPPDECNASICWEKSLRLPYVPGYWKIAPKILSLKSVFSTLSTTISIPIGSALVFKTAIFCG